MTMGMAKRITVRVQMSETEAYGLDALCRDLNMDRADTIRHAISRTLMRSTLEKCEAAEREENIRQMEATDREAAKWLFNTIPMPSKT